MASTWQERLREVRCCTELEEQGVLPAGTAENVDKTIQKAIFAVTNPEAAAKTEENCPLGEEEPTLSNE